MRKFTEVSAKSMMCFALVGIISVTGINKPVGKEAVNKELSKENIKSVYNEIKKSSLSTQEINEISETALVDGKETAEKINKFENQVDYEAALNYAMTSYYKNEKFDEMSNFEMVIDDRAEEIINGYKVAAEERAKGDSNGYEAGTVLLSFEKGTPKDEIKAMVEAEYGECRDIFECFNGDYLVTVDISLGQTVDMAKDAFKEYSITEAAGSNDYEKLADIAEGSVNDPGVYNQYYLNNLNCKAAWDLVSESAHEKVLVGVIDSGIQLDHPDLKNVISPKSAIVTSSTGKPVLMSTQKSTYDSSHGTEVAGIIAAEANNGKQIAGVASCYNNDVVEILAVKVTQYYESENDYLMPISFVVRAINYCVSQGVKVINYSGSGSTYNEIRYGTIFDANTAGVTFVCSAGNSKSDDARYPSDNDNTISVVSTTSLNNLSSFSSYGMKKDFAAPGTGTLTTTVNSGTVLQNGTSFSSPAVAGVVAMMYSLDMSLNFDRVYDILAQTSVDIGLGSKCKNGLVSAYKAVKAVKEAKEKTNIDTNGAIETTKVQEVEDEINAPQIIQPETTVMGVAPLEVIGALVTSPSENTVAVVWGQDAERIQKKYKYNVYVNGVKKLSLVDCNYYTISDVEAGNATVRIAAVLNGIETAGVVQNVMVNGTIVSPNEIVTEQMTTVEATTEAVTEEVTTAEETTTEEETTVEVTTENQIINLSKGKTTTASSCENDGLAAKYATDGDMSTRWSSAWTDFEWLKIDLATRKYISYVEIDWEAAYSTGYHFLISNDGVYWTILKSAGNGIGGKERIYINEYARFIKLQCTDRSTEYGHSIYEMSVFGY